MTILRHLPSSPKPVGTRAVGNAVKTVAAGKTLRTQPVGRPVFEPHMSTEDVSTGELPALEPSTRELAAVESSPGELPPQEPSTREVATVEPSPGELPALERWTRELSADQPPVWRLSAERPWYLRPWRQRVQATDVAIVGLILVIGLVSGLVFLLGGSSRVKGVKPLAGHQLSGSGGPSATRPGSQPVGSSGSTVESPTTTNAAAGSHAAAGGSPVGAAAGASAPGRCTPADLTITTVTNSGTYAPGTPVVATTRLVDNVTCTFDPVPAGQYSCPTTMTVVNQVGAQVYPLPGQGEQCGAVAGGTLVPGATRTAQITWSQDDAAGGRPSPAPAGQYSVVGTWAWSNGGSSPDQASADSPQFTIGP